MAAVGAVFCNVLVHLRKIPVVDGWVSISSEARHVGDILQIYWKSHFSQNPFEDDHWFNNVWMAEV